MGSAVINGVNVEFDDGMTILQAARKVGVYIPVLCEHPALEVVGACRICLVEVENAPKLMTACSTPITDGMVIHTDTEKIRSVRRTIIELLLADHPLDCFSCPSSGKCELQRIAYDLGVEDSPYRTTADASHRFDVVDENPFIERDPNKCILCGKCVRVCDTHAHYSAIDFMYRSSKTMVMPPVGCDLEHSDCKFCGQCVALCPVGALTEKTAKGKGRAWDLKQVKTVCAYCGVGCELIVEVNTKTGKIANVTSDHTNTSSPNKGRTCVKGRFAWEFVHSPDRLTVPLIKENGAFREATWDEALDRVYKGLKDNFGASAFLSSARCTNEDNYIMQRFAREVMRTNNVDHCARLCHAASVAGLGDTLGSGAMTNDYESIKSADVIMVIGSNTTETHPVIGSMIKERVKNGAKLIVCDPRNIELHRMADVSIRQKGGSDVALLNGMMNVIISEGLQAKDFIAERTEFFDDLAALVSRYTPEYTQKITGVPAETIIKAARMYAQSSASALFYAMGITQHITGTNNVRSCSNLALLCGMYGRPGTGVNPLRGQNNVQGACDMGCSPNVLPGYQKVSSPAAQEKIKKLWGCEIPEGGRTGLAVGAMLEGALGGSIGAMYIMGENPMVTDPDTQHVSKALDALKFLVVQDIFLTETAQHADVVLPAQCWPEKRGTTTNTMRGVQLLRKAVDAPGEAREDWAIINELAKRFGHDWGFETVEDVFNDMARFTPSYAGISYARLENGYINWPCPNGEHPGTPILHIGKFTREGGKAKFFPCEWKAPHEWPDSEYPFLATTGRSLYHYHSGSMTRRSASGKFIKELYIEVNPSDAEILGVNEGAMVTVESRRGSVSGKARITDRVSAGMVFIPMHFGEAPANNITSSVWDPDSQTPGFKVSAAKVYKKA
ncbi:MAG: formate dehydrogenase subunit alpha [Synergistes sp.]|nr:formate dehydrogenase subunit alpha [Synergistes sp.]